MDTSPEIMAIQSTKCQDIHRIDKTVKDYGYTINKMSGYSQN